MEREGEVGWKPSESTGKAGKATLGCFPVYHEVDMCFTVKGCVSSMCVGTHSGLLNSIELHVV